MYPPRQGFQPVPPKKVTGPVSVESSNKRFTAGSDPTKAPPPKVTQISKAAPLKESPTDTSGAKMSLKSLGYLTPDDKCGNCGHFELSSGICGLTNPPEHVDFHGACPKFTASEQYQSGISNWDDNAEPDESTPDSDEDGDAGAKESGPEEENEKEKM